jgi:hypothetical protein
MSTPLDTGGPVKFGKGAIPSPPDGRDWKIAELLGAEPLAAAPASYVVPNLAYLPVLNQGDTPECVAFAHSALKAFEDRIDQGSYFDFNEYTFFYSIGGTANGAVIRNALDKLVNDGYPVVNIGNAYQHKIAAYYRIPEDIETIKQAIMAFGPVIMGTEWYQSWENLNSNYQLPAPSGSQNGHAFIIVGWDYRGFRCRNSWGTAWGQGGDFYMPFSYALTYGFEFWKAIDQIVTGPDVFEGYHIIIEGAYTMTGYVVSPTCTLTPKVLHFGAGSSASVTRGVCGGMTYWKASGTLGVGYGGISYICGLTGYGWHIVKRYRRSNGTTYDTRIPCVGT